MRRKWRSGSLFGLVRENFTLRNDILIRRRRLRFTLSCSANLDSESLANY